MNLKHVRDVSSSWTIRLTISSRYCLYVAYKKKKRYWYPAAHQVTRSCHTWALLPIGKIRTDVFLFCFIVGTRHKICKQGSRKFKYSCHHLEFDKIYFELINLNFIVSKGNDLKARRAARETCGERVIFWLNSRLPRCPKRLSLFPSFVLLKNHHEETR